MRCPSHISHRSRQLSWYRLDGPPVSLVSLAGACAAAQHMPPSPKASPPSRPGCRSSLGICREGRIPLIAREGLPPMSRRPPECLEHDYGLVVGAFRPHPSGFESECWVADEEWFVKVWRSRRRPARLDLLHDLCAVGLPVPAPVRTVSGELHATWQGRPYAVFPYVHGHAQRDDEWRQAAQALRSVHELPRLAANHDGRA